VRIIYYSLALASLIGLSSAGIAVAQTNTAFGAGALASPSSANLSDSAFGFLALNSPTSGTGNTASGVNALYSNTTGSSNTATGTGALGGNTTGTKNTATGVDALGGNTSGYYNTATGAEALRNTTGSYNIAVGFQAGYFHTTGSNNIDIGSKGVVDESKTIRIGVPGVQTATYIVGISGTPVMSGSDVVVNSAGRLGVVLSSARYKHDIRDMGEASSKLLKLHPVTFRYNNDPDGTLQYGLIAEEVEKVYPELVVYGADGKVETVRYSMLTSMLLNEVQRQAKENQRQGQQIRILAAEAERKDDQIASQQKQIDALRKEDAQIDALAERMNALERQARLARPEHLVSAMP